MNNKKSEGTIAKGVLVGAAVLAGGIAAMALNDMKTRNKIGESLKDMGDKGRELKTKAEKWVKDPSIDNKVV